MSYVPPPDPQACYTQVWRQVKQIPYGKVATYGQIAKLITPPEGIELKDYAACASRWVGLAMAASPEDVPWQRVINSQGRISHRPEAGKQKHRLEQEGVLFFDGKIDLKQYQWRDPSQQDAPEQGSLF